MPHGDITHIEIPVTDFATSGSFYSALFGWQIAEAPGFEGYPMWQAPNKISGGALTKRDDDFTQPRSYVEVDSIDDALAAAKANGGTVVAEKRQITETSWWAIVADPDGNELGLYEGMTAAPES
ncbi:VOC family protein [Microbacterium rhizosphaerae]|uniref:VOC family protein n=1 Tax=Microbacterium rhizosphaerae TaxID=1678237 RepID=A0ABZ0SH91_9MICO|nr:VOC family protein [Microbacterium rhizosphaerae]WPR88571.1 VOC family protein [Microbacterium rhizosphaerae]